MLDTGDGSACRLPMLGRRDLASLHNPKKGLISRRRDGFESHSRPRKSVLKLVPFIINVVLVIGTKDTPRRAADKPATWWRHLGTARMEPPWRLAGSHAIVATPNLVLIKVVCHNLGMPDVRSPAMPRVVISRWSSCPAGRYLGHARGWARMYPKRDEAMPPPPTSQRSSPSRVMRVVHRLWGGS
jgi:hypothetical protein